jgi:hypothetical protein
VPFPLKKLRRILKAYDAWEDASRGKGSHTMFFRRVEGAVFSYPIPTHRSDVNDSYVKGVRKRLKLTPADGVSDDEFFGQA